MFVLKISGIQMMFDANSKDIFALIIIRWRKVKTRVLCFDNVDIFYICFSQNINELLWLISYKEVIYLKTGVRNKAIKFFL